jgi:hypothetical protein
LLTEVKSVDEFLGLIAHEVGHEYFSQYSIYSRFLLKKVAERDKETALTRHLGEVLGIVELQCDAFASLTVAFLGYDPMAFIECLERIAKNFSTNAIDFHPAENVRRKNAAAIITASEIKLRKPKSTLLGKIKAELASMHN